VDLTTRPALSESGLEFQRAEPRAATRSGIGYAMDVLWLVIALSGIIQFVSDIGGFNLYYAVVGVFIIYFLVFRTGDILRLGRKAQFWLWLVGTLLVVFIYLSGPGTAPWASYLVFRTRIVFFSFVAGTALVMQGPDSRSVLRTAALITLGIAIPINLVEIVVPNIFSTATGRAAGFYQNPNDSAAAIILCLLFVIDLHRPSPRGIALASIATAAVFATFSRMGMVFGLILWTFYAIAVRTKSRGQSRGRIAMVAGVLFVGMLGVFLLSQYVTFSQEATLRLRSILLADLSDPSARARERVAEISWEQFLAAPWFGHGLGTVEELDLIPHNSFLYIAVDIGVFGLLYYVILLLVPWLQSLAAGWSRAAAAIAVSTLLIYTSFFTHYVHSTMYFAVAFGVLAAGTLIDQRVSESSTDTPVPSETHPRESPATIVEAIDTR